MKRLFLVLVLMLGLAACVEESLDETTRNSIGFEPMVGKNTIIKATELNDDNFSEFRVWAYYTSDEFAPADASIYFSDLEVVKSGNTWDYSGNQYWPLTGNLSFFGIGGDDNENLAISLEENSPFPSFSYTVTNNPSQQKDLIAAVITNQTKSINGSSAVDMQFYHILTQVNFSLKGKNPNLSYIIHKIEVQDAFNVGEFKYNSNIIGEANTSTWTIDENNLDSYVYYTHPEAQPGYVISPVEENQEHNFIPFGNGTSGEALMLIPQTFQGKVIVTYEVEIPGRDNLEKTAEINFNELNNGEGKWEMGSKIRYLLTLPVGGSIIEFDVASNGVDGW